MPSSRSPGARSLPTLRALLRDAVAAALYAAGLSASATRHRDRLVVLTLHRVLPEPLRRAYPFPRLAVTPEELDWLLVALSPHYELGTLRDMHALHEGDDDLARPPLALTFDDGSRDNFEHAQPVLARHGVRATFFVPVEAIDAETPLWHDRLGFAAAAVEGDRSDALAARVRAFGGSGAEDASEIAELAKTLSPVRRRDFIDALEDDARGARVPPWAGVMRWDEVRALVDAGHEIGSHSMTHELLPQLEAPALSYEATCSRSRLRAELPTEPIDSFCYPNGDLDPRVVAAVEEAGYRRAVTTRPGVNEKGQPSLALHRFDIDAHRLRNRQGELAHPLLAMRLRA